MSNIFSFRSRVIALVILPALFLFFVAIGAQIWPDHYYISFIAIAGIVITAALSHNVITDAIRSSNEIQESLHTLASGEKFIPVPESNTFTNYATTINGIYSGSKARDERQREEVKSGIAEIVVNLARRNQSLLERQVSVIDDLEGTEEDPERLEKLFAVDHLTTRMRRNSESLLVLADDEAPKRRGQPVKISDVMRVAVGEVENYENLEVICETDAKVSAGAAVDLAHLLAELIENASHFSPPDKSVQIVGKVNIDDDYVLNVIDHGMGMSEPQRELANDILDNPPDLDLSMSRSLGFAVVGRLSKRLKMRANVYETPESGVTAVVKIPKELLVGKKTTKKDDKSSLITASEPKPKPQEAQVNEIAVVDETQTVSSGIGSYEVKSTVPNSEEIIPEEESYEIEDSETKQGELEENDNETNTEETISASEEKVESEQPKVEKLEDAVPSGEAFESGVESLLKGRDDSNTAVASLGGLKKRKRGEAKIPLGEGRTIPSDSTKSVAASSRKPEEIRAMLSKYRGGIKGEVQSKSNNDKSKQEEK